MTVLPMDPVLIHASAAGRTPHRTEICLRTKLHYLSHTSSRTAIAVLILRQMLSLARKENTALAVYLYWCIVFWALSEVMEVVLQEKFKVLPSPMHIYRS